VRRPDLGGRPEYLDIVGAQLLRAQPVGHERRADVQDDPRYVPPARSAAGIHERYGRPLFIAETGTEGDERAPWFAYVAAEAEAAIAQGTPVEGVCLYPILNHLGWDDDRHCPNGLLCGIAPDGARDVYQPLADELARWRGRLPGERVAQR
jgi:hypothetical protein